MNEFIAQHSQILLIGLVVIVAVIILGIVSNHPAPPVDVSEHAPRDEEPETPPDKPGDIGFQDGDEMETWTNLTGDLLIEIYKRDQGTLTVQQQDDQIARALQVADFVVLERRKRWDK